MTRPLPSVACAAASLALSLSLAAPPARAVIGGEPADALAPGLVMVVSRRGFCSGSVLAPDIVLTAGHCVAGPGDYRVHFRDEAGAPVFVAPAAIALHPGYDRGAAAGRRKSIDLALIRLAEPLPARFRPVVLSSDAAPAPTGAIYTLAGFGLGAENSPATGGTLRQARLGVIAPYGPSSILVWLADPAAPKAGAGACTGDSGGAIFNAKGDLAAVTTWAEGSGKKKCGALTQGVLVGPQRGWIDRVVEGWRS